jgi:hypothetical protein
MAGTLRGIAHHPDFELIGVDVVECTLLLLLDCFLQVMDNFHLSTEKALALSSPRIQQLSEISVAMFPDAVCLPMSTDDGVCRVGRTT